MPTQRSREEPRGSSCMDRREGLSPSDALAVVLATAGLTHRITDGELVVIRIAPR